MEDNKQTIVARISPTLVLIPNDLGLISAKAFCSGPIFTIPNFRTNYVRKI